jgi:hypothetical protein
MRLGIIGRMIKGGHKRQLIQSRRIQGFSDPKILKDYVRWICKVGKVKGI